MVYGYLWYFDPKRMSLHDVGIRYLRQHHDFDCPPGATDDIKKYPLLLDLAQDISSLNAKWNITDLCDDSALPHYLSPTYVGLKMAYEVGESFCHALNLAGLLQCSVHSIRYVWSGEEDDSAESDEWTDGNEGSVAHEDD
jgi:hypothetical protein